jgi:hypothetical protein
MVRYYVVIVPRLINMAVPGHGTAMWPDGKPLLQPMQRLGAEWKVINKIQAPVHWKFNIHHLFNFLVDGFYASDLLRSGHSCHLWCNWTPVQCSMMIYSLPMGLEASSLQSRILGVGMLVLLCTKNVHNGKWLRYTSNLNEYG